ncbi:hypothetical protein [Chitinophaga solisilvae]|uniref:hypothetical protein n=1 Tax=Chitinophaga solisilvae TaxID=1233460 RepID=UPI0013685453|nr:hypothetical protein [Chitinophaga solisilvae]
MENNNSYQQRIIKNDMLLAFSLYLDGGFRAVERIFPEYTQFVSENKDKSLSAVKKLLFSSPRHNCL